MQSKMANIGVIYVMNEISQRNILNHKYYGETKEKGIITIWNQTTRKPQTGPRWVPTTDIDRKTILMKDLNKIKTSPATVVIQHLKDYQI